MTRTALGATLLAACLTACGSESLPTTGSMSHPGTLMLSDVSQAASAQSLSALRRLTASLHDTLAAKAAGYNLLVVPPLTATDGCISDANMGGMGYHYTRGNNLGDDAIDLLDPEFIVYAPKNGPIVEGAPRTRLAALEYFLPFTDTWRAPTDPKFVKAPTLHDFPSTSDLPDVAFVSTTRFGGWMLHIWLWEDNPAGMFANFNTSVPLCLGSSF